MNMSGRIWERGWGAIFLTLYSLGVIHLFLPNEHSFKVLSAVPAIFVMFVAERYSTKIIDYFAGGELRRSTDQVVASTGEAFYEQSSEKIQRRVDDFDEKAYRENVSILSGGVIALTAPLVGYLEYSVLGLVIGFTISSLALLLLSRQGIEALNELAENVSRPFEVNHED